MDRVTIMIEYVSFTKKVGAWTYECSRWEIKDGCLWLYDSGREGHRLPLRVMPLFLIESFFVLAPHEKAV